MGPSPEVRNLFQKQLKDLFWLEHKAESGRGLREERKLGAR